MARALQERSPDKEDAMADQGSPSPAVFSIGRLQWHEQRRRWRRHWFPSPVLDRLAAPTVPPDDGREPPTPDG